MVRVENSELLDCQNQSGDQIREVRTEYEAKISAGTEQINKLRWGAGRFVYVQCNVYLYIYIVQFSVHDTA